MSDSQLTIHSLLPLAMNLMESIPEPDIPVRMGDIEHLRQSLHRKAVLFSNLLFKLHNELCDGQSSQPRHITRAGFSKQELLPHAYVLFAPYAKSIDPNHPHLEHEDGLFAKRANTYMLTLVEEFTRFVNVLQAQLAGEKTPDSGVAPR